MNATLTRMAAAVSLAMLQISNAQAQQAKPADAAATAPAAQAAEQGNSLNLEKVIVTGTSVKTTKMKSSVSVSTLDPDQIQLSAPISSADLLRSIPGVHAEASAGEGNTNVTVRGVPISAGGSRYVGFQEDGLPLFQNGDYNFITPDMFVKVDGTLSHIEAVRGGSASVLGSNAPGGIINFITKTGDEKGGSVSLSKGLGFKQTRYEFDYGAPLSDSTRFFIGGFYRSGEGSRHGGMPIEDGGQVKANITHELGGGSFIRLHLKHLDDKSPLEMPLPHVLSHANPTKANPATIAPFPGFDVLKGSYYSPYWSSITGRGVDNTLTQANLNDGLSVKENALGLQASFKLGNGWTLDEHFRRSSKSGRFLVAYPATLPFTATAGTLYASGPNKGKPYTGNVIEASGFDATFDDVGNTVNAIKASKTFDVGGKLTTVFGWDTSLQTIGVTQNLPHYLITAVDRQPAMLSGVSAGGARTDASGLLPDASSWGHATRALKYDMSSPYISLAYETGGLNLDGGVRRDSQKVSGSQRNAVGGSGYVPGSYPATPDTPVNYSKSYTSFSLGGNYKLAPGLAAFARYSDGAAFAVVERGTGVAYDGSAPTDIYTVKQTEVGVKWRRDGLSAFVTLFDARTAEGNVEITTGTVSQNTYSAKGVELEAAYRMGSFNVNAGLTYTDASIASAKDAAIVGNAPRRLAKTTYQITPSYKAGALVLGGSIIGTDKSFGDDQNTIIMPAFYTMNLFAAYQLDEHSSVSLSANNVTNQVGYTEYGGGQGSRSINGRTVKLGLKYTF